VRSAHKYWNQKQQSLDKESSVDPQTKKTALRMITHGLYLLTVRYGDRFNASTISWLSQASFEPPLVMVGVKADSLTHAMVEGSGHFAINLLTTDQTEMAQAFFKEAKHEGTELSGYAFEPGPVTGAPIFLDAPAWFECKVTEAVKRGDHTVVVAEVVEAGVHDPNARPLALRDTSWHYGG
jgi:flavin reductase (DIM6/NTAB) family NADH-FMN oxidoreductase RutF